MKVLTPPKAIHAKCLNCSGDQPKEVRLCPLRDCALWNYRMGHRPRPEDFAGKTPTRVPFFGQCGDSGDRA